MQLNGAARCRCSIVLDPGRLDNPYGDSKRAAEEDCVEHAGAAGLRDPVIIYRLPNVFGKWCRPNYNSVVATFCHNIAATCPSRSTTRSRN